MLSVLRIIRHNINNIKYFSTTPKIFNNLEYTETHEWLYHTSEYTKIGLSKEAIEQLGEIVFVDPLLESNETASKSEDITAIESVKTVEYIHAPYNCVILENNTELMDNLEQIGENPECTEKSWFVKIKKLK